MQKGTNFGFNCNCRSSQYLLTSVKNSLKFSFKELLANMGETEDTLKSYRTIRMVHFLSCRTIWETLNETSSSKTMHTRDSHKLKFCMKSLIFSRAIWTDILLKGYPERQIFLEVAKTEKCCSKHQKLLKRDGPNDNDKVFNDLHVTEISNKVATRLYFLRQLRKRLDQRPRNILQHLYSSHNGIRMRNASPWAPRSSVNVYIGVKDYSFFPTGTLCRRVRRRLFQF